jgi:hypothetical protein
MKNVIIIIITIIGFTIACKAQEPVAKIATAQIKVKNVNYKLIKPDSKVTQIINTNNKLSGVKMIAPKLPSDVRVSEYVMYDKNILIQICVNVIPFSTLQKLPKSFGDWLFITFKVDVKGRPLEMEFLIKNTSLITANEIQKIEAEIMKSPFKITFIKGIERYFDGANYFNIDTQLRYSDMLKAKQAN